MDYKRLLVYKILLSEDLTINSIFKSLRNSKRPNKGNLRRNLIQTR